MGIPKVEFVKWLGLQCADLTDEGAANRFELYHTTAEEQSPERLGVFFRNDDVEVSTLAQRIWDTAEQDAGTRVGGAPERYTVAMYRTDGEEHESQHSFLVALKGSKAIGIPTEPATEKGYVAGVQRQNEVYFRAIISELEHLRSRNRELEAQNRQWNDAAFGQTVKARELVEVLLNNQSERQINEAKALSTARRQDDFWNMVSGTAQSVVGQVMLGKGISKPKELPSGAKLDSAFLMLGKATFAFMRNHFDSRVVEKFIELFPSMDAKLQLGEILNLVQGLIKATESERPEAFRDANAQEKDPAKKESE